MYMAYYVFCHFERLRFIFIFYLHVYLFGTSRTTLLPFDAFTTKTCLIQRRSSDREFCHDETPNAYKRLLLQIHVNAGVILVVTA